MDVLSDVLAVLRTGRPQSMLLGHDAPWGQEFAEVPGAMGFQVILRGECWLLPPGGSEPVRLVLLIAAPGDDSAGYLSLLQKIATACVKYAFVSDLDDARTPEALADHVAAAVSRR